MSPQANFLSITKKLIISIILFSTFLYFLAICAQLAYDYYSDVEDIGHQLDGLEKSYYKSLGVAAWNCDTKYIATQLEGIEVLPGIESVVLQNIGVGGKNKADTDGVVFDSLSKGKITSKRTFTKIFNLHSPLDPKDVVGKVTIVAGIDYVIEKIKKRFVVILLTQTVQIFLVIIFMYLIFQLIITGRLLRISQYFRLTISSSDSAGLLTIPHTKRHRPDEIDEIVGNINERNERITTLVEDISDLNKGLEMKVQKRTKELELKNNLLSELLGTNRTLLKIVSHDISNPLSVIITCLQLIKKRGQYKEDDIVGKSLVKMNRAAGMVSQILAEVKELEALRSGKKKLGLTPIDFSEIINDTQFVFESKLMSKKLELRYEDKLFGAKINAEKASLTNNVINNIVSNAIKFSFENSTIDVVAEDMGDTIKVEISDHGTGIPTEVIEKLFDPNAITSRKGTSGETGTGFGMPIVKEYLDMYGASIEVKSTVMPEEGRGKVDHGTTFALIFKKIDPKQG